MSNSTFIVGLLSFSLFFQPLGFAKTSPNKEQQAACRIECPISCEKNLLEFINPSLKSQALAKCIEKCESRCSGTFELREEKKQPSSYVPAPPPPVDFSDGTQVPGRTFESGGKESDVAASIAGAILIGIVSFGYLYFFNDRPALESQTKRTQRLHGDLYVKGGYVLGHEAHFLGDFNLNYSKFGLTVEGGFVDDDQNQQLAVIQGGVQFLTSPKRHSRLGLGVGFLHVNQSDNSFSGGYMNFPLEISLADEFIFRFTPMVGVVSGLELARVFTAARLDITPEIARLPVRPTLGWQLYVFRELVYTGPVAGLAFRF